MTRLLMKKVLAAAAALLFVSLALSPHASAEDVWNTQSSALGTSEVEDALPGDALEILGNAGISEDADLDSGLSGILASLQEKAAGIFSDALKRGAAVLAVAVLTAAAGSVFGTDGKKNGYVVLAGVLAVAAISAGSTGTLIKYGGTVLDELDDFSKVLLPTLTAAAASSGAVTSAAAKYAAAALFVDILMTVGRKIVLPLIYIYIAASVGSAAVGGKALAGAANFVKWLAMFVLTATVSCFVLYLTVTGTVSAAADEAAVKVTKTLLSASLPVVGGIISDAAGSVAGGISILKNAIGVFGVLAVAAVCAVPALKMASNYLVFKGAAALAGAVADERISRLTGDIATALGMTLGLTGASAVMMFISVISLMKAVTGG